MGMRTENLAEETRSLRFRLHALVAQGMTERRALLKVLPDDDNRSRKLKTWRSRGLYPVPEEEILEYGSHFDETDSVRTSKLPDTTSKQADSMVETTSNLVRGRVVTPEMESMRTSEEAETLMESHEPQLRELVVPVSGATINILGGLVENNSEEIQDMMELLLTLHRAGKLSALGKEPVDTPPASAPPMPKLQAKPLSIYCNENLRKMAELKALSDPNLPAGTTWNRSSLTSYLLWQYLGCPSKEEIDGFSEE